MEVKSGEAAFLIRKISLLPLEKVTNVFLPTFSKFAKLCDLVLECKRNHFNFVEVAKELIVVDIEHVFDVIFFILERADEFEVFLRHFCVF